MNIEDAVRELFEERRRLVITTDNGTALQLTPISAWQYRLRVIRRRPQQPSAFDVRAVCQALSDRFGTIQPTITQKKIETSGDWSWVPLLIWLPVFGAGRRALQRRSRSIMTPITSIGARHGQNNESTDIL